LPNQRYLQIINQSQNDSVVSVNTRLVTKDLQKLKFNNQLKKYFVCLGIVTLVWSLEQNEFVFNLFEVIFGNWLIM